MMLTMTEDGGDEPVEAGSDMVASSVENDSWMQRSIRDGRGMGTESRELAVGVDGNSGAGTGLDVMATRWRGRVWRKTRLFVIQMGGATRAGLSAMRTEMWRLG
jgi:hypothetical protein